MQCCTGKTDVNKKELIQVYLKTVSFLVRPISAQIQRIETQML